MSLGGALNLPQKLAPVAIPIESGARCDRWTPARSLRYHSHPHITVLPSHVGASSSLVRSRNALTIKTLAPWVNSLTA